ncbi:MAG TPA: M56 family metallopeptidase [Vicinamibacterales bacterium]|nr:M56 family metallopeptidase [Vicinamibacterales bacterium]
MQMIKATVVLAVAWMVIPRLRARSAAERHLLWASALGIAALLPWLDEVLPAWRPHWAQSFSAVLPDSLDLFGRWTQAAEGGEIVVRATGVEPAGWTAGIAAALWLLGAAVALVRLARQLMKLANLAANPVRDLRIEHLLESAASAVGVRGRPALLICPGIGIPVTWGIRRPRVVLPVQALQWSNERLTAVFAHELAHVARADWPVHLAAETICAAYWFHPFYWLARTGMRRESERAADDAVMAIGIDPHDYAEQLVAIVRAARLPAPVQTLAMARTSDLAGRIAALVSGSPNRRRVSGTVTLAVTTCAALVSLPLAALAGADVAAYVQVRTAALPKALLAAVAPASGTSATAVRAIRVASAAVGPSTVQAPEVLEYTTPPLYSTEARRDGVEGVVVVRARIDIDGRARSLRILSGLGAGLDQNALVALRQWLFRPGTRNGVAEAMDADVDIDFSLRQETLNELIANDMATQVGPGVTPPRAIVSVQPPRIPGARATVVLDVVLLENGIPKILRILQSAGTDLDEAAVRTFEQWRFSPAARGDTPVKVRMTAEVNLHG